MLNHYNPDGGGNGGPMGRFEFTQGTTSMPGATLTQFNSMRRFCWVCRRRCGDRLNLKR